MTPEHNPPKDPSLEETKVLPRPPDGYCLLVDGDPVPAGALVWIYRRGPWEPCTLFSDRRPFRSSEMNPICAPIAPAPQAPKCETCDDTRQVDSGGQNPDGSWINSECPECATPSEAGDWGETFMRLGGDLARAEKQYRECLPAQLDRARDIMREAGDRWRDHIDSKAKSAPQATEPKDPVLGDATAPDLLAMITDIRDRWKRGEFDDMQGMQEIDALVSIIQPDGGKK